MIRILKRIYLFTFLFVVYSTNNLHAQNENLYTIPDSLLHKTDTYLLEQFRRHYADTAKATIYLSSVLTKATMNNNTLNRVKMLSLLTYYEKEKDKKIKLIETALSESEHIEHLDLIPIYNTAGVIYQDYYLYENAIKQYVKALNIVEKYQIKDYKYTLYNNIAQIKVNIGKYDEALELYKKNLAYEKSKTNKDSLSILISEVNTAESFRYNKEHDSASYYYEDIITNYSKLPDTDALISIATINQGINLFYQKKYEKSQELIQKGTLNKNINELIKKQYILSQLYLGKLSLNAKDTNKAEYYFYKVDSLLTESNSIIPEAGYVYEFFLKKYERENNFPAQIHTINKYMAFDSIVNIRKINTVNRLHSEFDIPELIKSKEIAIKKLRDKNSSLSNRAIYLLSFVCILILLFVFQYRKHKIYKKRFNELIAKPISDQKITNKTSTINKTGHKEINIDEKLISKILNQLEDFEKKHLYLKRDITIHTLAKSFSTNTRYLSKIINIYKQKKFIHYINDLRIDYIVKELKTNTTLQRYTIKSIGEEAGFNNSESFSTAFKKKTGIKPSYFIKNIKKEKSF